MSGISALTSVCQTSTPSFRPLSLHITTRHLFRNPTYFCYSPPAQYHDFSHLSCRPKEEKKKETENVCADYLRARTALADKYDAGEGHLFDPSSYREIGHLVKRCHHPRTFAPLNRPALWVRTRGSQSRSSQLLGTNSISLPHSITSQSSMIYPTSPMRQNETAIDNPTHRRRTPTISKLQNQPPTRPDSHV